MTHPICFLLLLAALTGCAGTAPLPPAALGHNQVGALALENGDLELAGARFNLALEYNPDFVEAVANLGSVELQRGNFERARQLLLRARRLNPDFAQAHHGLGVLAERELRRADASEHYRAALSVDPGFPHSRANLARLLFEAGHYDHALVQYRRLRAVAPEMLATHVGFVASLLGLRRVVEARQALEALTPKQRAARKLKLLEARLSLIEGDFANADPLLRELSRQTDETGALALSWLSVSELGQSRPRAAIGAAETALSLEPNQPVASYALAVALAQLNDPGAPAWLERALTLNPNHPTLLKIKNHASEPRSD